jgi:hypothetical protein
MEAKQNSSMAPSQCSMILNELNDVLHMLDQELESVQKDPQIPVLTQPVKQNSEAVPPKISRSAPLDQKDLEALVDLLVERQLPRVSAQLKKSVMNEVRRILPAKE